MPFGGRVNWGTNDDTDLEVPADGQRRSALAHDRRGAHVRPDLGRSGVQARAIRASAPPATSSTRRSTRRRPGRTTGIVDSTHREHARASTSRATTAASASAPCSSRSRTPLARSVVPGAAGPRPADPQGLVHVREPARRASTAERHPHARTSISISRCPTSGARASGARPTDAFELRVFGDWTRWSKLTSQCINLQAGTPTMPRATSTDGTTRVRGRAVVTNIPRNWKDTYGGHLGVELLGQPGRRDLRRRRLRDRRLA